MVVEQLKKAVVVRVAGFKVVPERGLLRALKGRDGQTAEGLAQILDDYINLGMLLQFHG